MSVHSVFADLPDAELEHCATALTGEPQKGSRSRLVQLVEQALASPSRLTALVTPLPQGSRIALDILAEASLPQPEPHIDFELSQALGSQGASSAMRNLMSARLIVTYSPQYAAGDRHIGLLPPLADALRPMFDSWWRASQTEATASPERPTEREVSGLPFLAQVLLVHLAARKPRVTQDGDIYAVDFKKLVSPFSLGKDAVQHLLMQLKRIGLLKHDGTDRIGVDWARAQELLCESAPRRLIGMRLLPPLERLRGGETAALRLLRRRPGFVAKRQVLSALRLGMLREASRYWVPSVAEIEGRAKRALAVLVDERLVQFASDGASVRLSNELKALMVEEDASSVAPVEDPRPPICHLQPNFEVIVPPEADAKAVLAVGRIAELRGCDQVATFGITRASVQNGIASGLCCDDLLASLAASSRFPVPANVAQGIVDFANELRPAHVFSGLVVVVEGAKDPPSPGLQPTALPGVFVADPQKARGMVKALEKSRFTVSYADGSPAMITSGIEVFPERDAEEHLQRYLGAFATDEPIVAVPELPPAPPPPEPEPEPQVRPSVFDQRLAECELPWNAVRALGRAGIHTIGAMVSHTEAELRRLPNVGPVALRRIKSVVGEMGLVLGKKSPTREDAARDNAECLATLLDIDTEAVRLLSAALAHAPKPWHEHSAGLADDIIGDLADPTLEMVNAEGVDVLQELFDAAIGGFSCCGVPPIMGPKAVSDAIGRGRDVLVWPLDSDQYLRLTPHRLGQRGKEYFVAGHVAGDGDDRSYGLDEAWVALGPKAAEQDRKRAIAARGPVTHGKVGRNALCPCGSGKKHKHCCLRLQPGA